MRTASFRLPFRAPSRFEGTRRSCKRIRCFETSRKDAEKLAMLLFGPGDLEEKMKSIMERFESTSEEIHVERDVIETNSESDPEDVFARQAEAEARMLSEIVSRIRMDAEDVLKCIEDGRSTSMAKMRLQESLDGANKALSQVGDGLANRTESASEMNLALSELQELLLWSEEGSES